MHLATALDLAGIVLGLFSACFFCIGVLHVKKPTLKLLATRFYGVGEQIAIELAKQKADVIFGTFLLFMSFVLQSVPKSYPEVATVFVTDEFRTGVIVSLATAITAMLALYLPWRLQRGKWVSAIESAVRESEEDARRPRP